MTDSLLARSVDILRWLEADADTGFDARLARDRQIGAALAAGPPVARVLGWWDAIGPAAGEAPSVGVRVAALRKVATFVLLGLGLVLGVGLGSLAFAYDGSHPVNVLALLGVLVGVPLLLLLATLVYLLPGRVPGLSAVRDAVATLNPGRWVGAWLDRHAGMPLFTSFSSTRSAFGRWQLLVFSQWFAAGYFVGVALAGLVLVAVSDLAFGWSSTLELETESVYQLFSFLALPWQSWLPGAVPDLELVAGSRYFRLETQPVSVAEAAALGAWWPFVLMTVLVWGLLPRLGLLLFGLWRARLAVSELLGTHPEVLALLDRLTPPHVDFGPELPEEGGLESGDKAMPPPAAVDEGTALLIWNQALGEAAASAWLNERLSATAGAVLKIGVGRAADGWATTLAEFFAGRAKSFSRLVVFSKGWEPPLLEFADFLEALRGALGHSATIVVVPINTRGDGIEAAEREIWAEFLGRHGDPRLYVMDAG